MSRNIIHKKRERKPFRPEEDEKLRRLVEQYGTFSWREISNQMDSRNPRQCRERWLNVISGESCKREWSPEEDSLILAKYGEFGPQWKAMEKFFQGRVHYDLRNRFVSLKRNYNRFIVNMLSSSKKSGFSRKPPKPRQPELINPNPQQQLFIEPPEQSIEVKDFPNEQENESENILIPNDEQNDNSNEMDEEFFFWDNFDDVF